MPHFKKTTPHKAWAHISEEDWTSWTWQLQNRITTTEALEELAKLDPDFVINIEDVKQTQQDFDFAITPYYLSLMNLSDVNCPIRVQGMPSSRENIKLENEFRDFPKEDTMMPVPGLTHRYPDRAMLYTTHHCAMYCRFCTRKRKVSDGSSALLAQQINDAIAHIKKTPAIREVILSGGDIFSFSNKQLKELLNKVSAIKHIEIIRLGSRNLVTLPFRVDNELIDILKSFAPIYVHTHFNHPNECSLEAQQACLKLRRSGVVVNNHSVILKGVNDHPAIISELNSRLTRMGVQPYYLYHCDLTFGTSHFRTHISDDIKLIRDLFDNRNLLMDLNLPHFMVDTPGGGKIELI
jgi:lysine 2,3-aminomutase